ncbi:MAG: hypothetical protein IJ736_03145 [Firmicutes bacterium]|nr:hypothetical protein [Bacillota bacterium]
MMNEYNENTEPTVSVKEWLITFLIMFVPVVNIIMIFLWAFGGGVSPTKANLFKLSLIVSAIVFILYILFFIIIMLMGGLASMGNY